tara:strand:- start:1185 stop:1574 length:390 start_codon:yes stop_codon:yes gene_type:complete
MKLDFSGLASFDPLVAAIGTKFTERVSIPPPPTPEISEDRPSALSAEEGSYGSSGLELMLEQQIPGWRELPFAVQAQVRQIALEQGAISPSILDDLPPITDSMEPTAASGTDKIFMPSSFRAGGRVGLI